MYDSKTCNRNALISFSFEREDKNVHSLKADFKYMFG